jgi:subtilase family serine protease
MKKQMAFLLLACAVVMTIGAQAPGGRIHPALEQSLRTLSPGERLAVIVELNEQASPAEFVSAMPRAGRRERARAVVNALKSVADRHQGPLLTLLKQQELQGAAEHVKPFWILNGFAVTAPETLIRTLASRTDVREIRLDARIPLPSLFRANEGEAAAGEWNIEMVRAPEVWGLGAAHDGTGAVIGSFDTGVDLTHPDLRPRYRGGHQTSWFDPYDEHTSPYDFHGHGTHTTGIAVGGDASGASIGVAPGAVWIAAKAWDDDGVGLTSAFHQIFEWFLAPGGNPDNAPDVVNCSWGIDQSGCDTEFLQDIEAWRAAGVFPAFAAGNDGPDPGSVRSPGAYPVAFAVGATDSDDGVADFSGQGPTPCDGSVKPDISAPGVGILSAVPGGYDIMSGSSMAAPHIAGAVAVLRSIDPSLTVDQLECALMFAAEDIADPGPDNSSGAGRLDLFAAAQIVILGPETPVVKVLATDGVATETGPTSGLFSVFRAGNTDSDLVVRFSIGGTATGDRDYASLGGSVTIPAGLTSAGIPVLAIDDLAAEPTETVILTLSPDPAYIISGSDTAVVTIQSDELLSDLTISSLTVPSGAGAGDSIALTETTRNQGGGAAEPSTTQFYLSANSLYDHTDIPLGRRSVDGLAAGASSSGSTTVTLPQDVAPGNWCIIARADAEELLTETVESNNSLARAIRIGPDLVVSAMTGPATAGAGQMITITETTKNQGGGAAGAFRTAIYLSTNSTFDASDTLLGARSVAELAAGASSSGSTTVSVPEGTAVGAWYILAVADGQAIVAETSETNNTFPKSVKIGPDLIVSAITTPAASGAGQTLTVTDTTKNQGGGTAGVSLTQLYLSADTTLDASDALLGSRSIAEMAAGASNSGSTAVSIPEGTAAGTWYILANADGQGAVTETSESNNNMVRSIKMGPDLIVTSISAPSSAGAGQTISVTDTTKNQGGGAAGAFRTSVYLSTNSTLDASDTLLGARSVAELAPGASSSGSTPVSMPEGTAAGTWYILAQADDQGAVTETSESNNYVARSIKLGPDLTVTAISAPSSAGAGQTISATDTTKNQGGGAAGVSLTQIYLSTDTALDASDTLLGSRSVAALAAGASSSGSSAVPIPEGTAAGNWYILAKADGPGAVTETSESNNYLVKSIKLGPDLIVTALSAPSSAGAGQTVSVTDTTKNQGGGAAGASRTAIYLSTNSTFDASDTLLGARDAATLAAGASGSGAAAFTIPPGTATGTWYIIAKADVDGVVPETSETNNTYSKTITIGPDLDITAMSAPSTARAGETISLSDTVKNIGAGSATVSQTYFYLSKNSSIDTDDILIGARSVAGLAAGGSSAGSTSVIIPAGTAAGTWYIIAKTDGAGTVAETSESNNTYLRALKVT